ncbi:transposase [Kitasatospora sp. NBC_00070]|uniref:transposase n=1 Tax=Kitasatospora sp. NBC_00070 TaxID=2975962 RepID=UPI00386013EE
MRQSRRDRLHGIRGYDPEKKISGRKRQVAVDTCGVPVMVLLTPADVIARDAARTLL